MNWNYFKTIKNLKVKKYFDKRRLSTKEEIKNFLDKENFTFTNKELEDIYATVNPPNPKSSQKTKKPEQKKTAKAKRVKTVLPQKKKNIRNGPRKKPIRHVSGSMGSGRKNWRMVFFSHKYNRIGV